MPAELVIERFVRFQACRRPAQYPLLKRTQAIPQGDCLVEAAQIVLQCNPHGVVLFTCLRAASLSASSLTNSLRILRGMLRSCIDVNTTVVYAL